VHLMIARSAMTLVLAATLTEANPEPKYRSVAHFEAPRSIGTPLEDLARSYDGRGLADRIVGRLRLETDASLTAATRQLIRRRLAQAS
jgi:hypothetical protein